MRATARMPLARSRWSLLRVEMARLRVIAAVVVRGSQVAVALARVCVTRAPVVTYWSPRQVPVKRAAWTQG